MDRENAAEIALNTQTQAVLDTTLSDWYVFNVPHSGQYRVTIHNIDVGCDIYVSAKHSGNAGEGKCVENENNASWTMDVQEGDSVYFEVYSYRKDPTANGTYILIIEEEEQS